MSRRLGVCLLAAGLALLTACSRTDQEKARERAQEARRKARVEAGKLAREAKQQARDLDRNIKDAVNGSGSPQNGDSQAGEKLRHGGDKLKAAGNEAGVKLDRAALIAKVKAKLANDVGLRTMTGVEVDANGQTVTLRGTVSSPEQKHEAEVAASQVSGVNRVVNELQVQP